LIVTPCLILILVIFSAIFKPSYTHLPRHYSLLEKICKESERPGRGNVHNEFVFIATTLYDPAGLFVRGKWGNAVRELVQLLGPSNVHLSIYENDPDPRAKDALEAFGKQITCASPPARMNCKINLFAGNISLVSEHLPMESFPRVLLPNSERLIERMAFLSEVRNRALRALRQDGSPRFDKLLFLNDVIFNPIDALQLLFSTNADSSGRAQYGAACAVDFINPFKFYDRFATRDLEGYSMGLPFFPWFTNAGEGASRQDVLDQKDAVRVRACWGGMVAFEAKWFQDKKSARLPIKSSRNGNLSDLAISPLRFHYEPDLFWDASECCLIHADLTYLRHGCDITSDSGIYTNPYVRVAYDSKTLGWLPYTRRIERLYSFIHNILNHLAGQPVYNSRRLTQPGDEVIESVWEYDQPLETPKGSYHKVKRIAEPGRFCGSRTLQVINEHPRKGEKKFMGIQPPS
jgi:hypothetical protein